MKRLVLVRHGESVWNAEGRIQGHACEGLSARGHAQAALAAAALARRHPDARLVTSDLRRTRETTAPIEEALGRAAEVDPSLRERTFGRWEGLTRDEVTARDAELYARWRDGEEVMPLVGGESVEHLEVRAVAAFRRLFDAATATVIAVTHGGPIWYGTHALIGLGPTRLGGVDNASVTELVDHGGIDGVVLERWNEVGHLPEDLRTGWVVRRRVD